MATGNVATEDLLYLLEHLGFRTDYRLDGVVRAARAVATSLDHPLASRVNKAFRL